MPGTNNFLQIDQAKLNILDDADYASNAITTSGAAVESTCPSEFFNKFGYQMTTFVGAFAQMMAAKNYNMSDASISALAGILANVRTNADSVPGMISVAFAGSMTFNAAAASGFTTTLTGNVTASTLSSPAIGEFIIFAIAQDATGGRTFTWPVAISGAGPVSSLASSLSLQCFIVLPDSSVHAVTPMIYINAAGVVTVQTTLVTVVSINSSGTVTAGQAEIAEQVDASGAGITRTLYSAIGAAGAQVIIKKIDNSANAVTVATTGGQTIDGQSTETINVQNNSATFLSNGANWIII